MAAVVSFDVYAYDGSRWTLQTRFPQPQRAQALAFAEGLYGEPHINGVRVVQETHDPDTGESIDQTIHKREKQGADGKRLPGFKGESGGASKGADSGKDKGGGDKGGGKGKDPPASRQSGFKESGPQIVSRQTPKVEKAAPPAPRKPAPAPAAPPAPSPGGAAATTMGPPEVSALLGWGKVGGAAAAATAAAYVTTNYVLVGSTVGVQSLAGVVAFAAIYVGAGWLMLTPQELDRVSRGFSRGPIQRRRAAAPAPLAAPVAASAAAPGRAPAAEPKPQAPPAAVAADDDAGIKPERLPLLKQDVVTVIKFLHESLSHLIQKTKHLSNGKLDAYNLFGSHLFIAGVCEGYARLFNRDKDEVKWILRKSLKDILADEKSSANFGDNFEEYLATPKYLEMFKYGIDAVQKRIKKQGGNEQVLATALDYWNKPQEENQKKDDFVVVMFTDIIGSTAFTQIHGDDAQYEMVKAHNNIVRAALTDFSGREIKHTGDGIMASFDSAPNSVFAAIQMQKGARPQHDAPQYSGQSGHRHQCRAANPRGHRSLRLHRTARRPRYLDRAQPRNRGVLWRAWPMRGQGPQIQGSRQVHAEGLSRGHSVLSGRAAALTRRC